MSKMSNVTPVTLGVMIFMRDSFARSILNIPRGTPKQK